MLISLNDPAEATEYSHEYSDCVKFLSYQLLNVSRHWEFVFQNKSKKMLGMRARRLRKKADNTGEDLFSKWWAISSLRKILLRTELKKDN